MAIPSLPVYRSLTLPKQDEYFVRQMPYDLSQGLVSSLDRNSERKPSALASPTDTSWERCRSTGLSDKQPVLVQHAGQGALATENVLPDSGFSVRTSYVQLEKNPVGEPSLSTEAECLSLHAECSTNVQERQGGAAHELFHAAEDCLQISSLRHR